MEFVNSIKEAEENAVRFSEVGRFKSYPAFKQLAMFSHWYYFPNSNVFGPSKFIGYKNTTLESYIGGDTGDGSDTHKRFEALVLSTR